MSSSTLKAASASTSTTYPITSYKPRHTTWPYTPADFLRQDLTPDTSFYSSPRFVTHIDEHAIAALKAYYASVLPRHGRILDFCSSWISHFPPSLESAVEKGELAVVGMGLNARELDANPVLGENGGPGRIMRDLNEDPDVSVAVNSGELFDAATCVVSIDYLTRPVEVLRSLAGVVKPGGRVHLVVSNRCFPTKAVRRWLRVDEEERLMMVGDYLYFAGWTEIEIVDLSGGEEEEKSASGVAGLMRWAGMGGHDPLWVVKGVKKVD
ncbi:uncharacterized protein BDZ99DRAFT_458024 [Mytilinidion resinicola]|uniref:S-adenosyl-L-methionine-dependent methyltransferase n=1 Tax=Mytilinidion resinicola TaxID=574789 RepID=A0A6A6Z5W6_9PEZI|nr:uncharacterized protein BDZ99DRAFT_458024 [Mytilinidion resinicola]KAF2816119.1 hypothetical protein BDZ99DRAFT_458024 [Mytilinidion resinicola]